MSVCVCMYRKKAKYYLVLFCSCILRSSSAACRRPSVSYLHMIQCWDYIRNQMLIHTSTREHLALSLLPISSFCIHVLLWTWQIIFSIISRKDIWYSMKPVMNCHLAAGTCSLFSHYKESSAKKLSNLILQDIWTPSHGFRGFPLNADYV